MADLLPPSLTLKFNCVGQNCKSPRRDFANFLRIFAKFFTAPAPTANGFFRQHRSSFPYRCTIDTRLIPRKYCTQKESLWNGPVEAPPLYITCICRFDDTFCKESRRPSPPLQFPKRRGRRRSRSLSKRRGRRRSRSLPKRRRRFEKHWNRSAARRPNLSTARSKKMKQQSTAKSKAT
jgi:hypothetical protein